MTRVCTLFFSGPLNIVGSWFNLTLRLNSLLPIISKQTMGPVNNQKIKNLVKIANNFIKLYIINVIPISNFVIYAQAPNFLQN